VTIELDAAARQMRHRLGADFHATTLAVAATGAKMREPAELERTLQEILRRHDPADDLHVFGYGSLMWHPALVHVGQARARVHGWHRCFCLRSLFGRGAPESPGLMLALDRGGSCNGMLLRIPAGQVREELALLWRREMTWGSYDARWVTAWAGATPLPAVTFVVNRGHERYVKGLPLQETVRMIDAGKGGLGTCRSYFDATVAKLRELGIRDGRMEQLHAALQRQ